MVITDYIIPNQKYYYAFRTKSQFDMVSNPSSVYEVELLKDADESKIVFNTIQFDDEHSYYALNEEKKSKNFKSLFQIFPSYHQTNFEIGHLKDENQLVSSFKGTEESIIIGSAEHKIWGRKFKIRIKSNDSGKVIDFNVKFDLVK